MNNSAIGLGDEKGVLSQVWHRIEPPVASAANLINGVRRRMRKIGYVKMEKYSDSTFHNSTTIVVTYEINAVNEFSLKFKIIAK